MSKIYNIVIAYAEDDNSEIIENGKGWVSNFQRFMEMMLGQLSGELLSISICNEKEIDPALQEADAFLIVLSPQFANSKPWSIFLDSIESDKDFISKIFKVVKLPVEDDVHPKVLFNLLDYDLYHVDHDTDEFTEITSFFGPEAEKEYWMRLVDLAYDVYSCVLKTKSSITSSGARKSNVEEIIYLAETGSDLAMHRNLIKRELMRYGYKVLPDQALPAKSEELEEKLREDLNKSKMSIHMIGNSFGELLPGSSVSILDIQNRVASEHAVALNGNSRFSRLIWLAPELTIRNEKQRNFIDSIKRSAENLKGAEILQTPLEDFKNIIRKKLIANGIEIAAMEAHHNEEEAGRKSVYFIYDKLDQAQADPIIKLLSIMGVSVLQPIFEGELMEIRNHHINNLRLFDWAIVFKHEVNDTWVRMKLFDLLKAPGFGREKPILGKALLSQEEVAIEAQFFGTYDIDILEPKGKNVEDVLHSFIGKNKINV